MAHNRKSKVNSIGKILSFLVSILILSIALDFAFSPTTIPNTTVPMTEHEPTSTESPSNTETQSQDIPVVPTATEEPVVVPPVQLKLHQINVGCANAYLLQFGDTNIFIDGGLYSSRNTVFSYLDEHGVTHIDAYIGTHWHGDHTDNAAELLSKYGDTETVLYGPSENVDGLVSMLRERSYKRSSSAAKLPSDVNYVQFKAGDILNFGDMELICVGPYTVKKGSTNYDSMNFVIRYGEFSVFMTADYVHSEQVLESYGDIIANVDVLQMPHHGLDPIYISSAALKHVNPKVILVPANTSSPTQKMVKNCGLTSKIYDNRSGNVVVTSYGDDYEIQTSK